MDSYVKQEWLLILPTSQGKTIVRVLANLFSKVMHSIATGTKHKIQRQIIIAFAHLLY